MTRTVAKLARATALRWAPLIMTLLWGLAAQGEAHFSAGPVITLTKIAQPTSIPPRGRVTYTIELVNQSPEAAQNVQVADLLPAGFRYVQGSTRIYTNHALISTADPSISGQQLTWRYFTLPSARSGSYYGIHTFVQERCNSDYINYQLDRARELMGPGAYVKQLFYWITPATQGPQACWVDFVNRAYDRGLVPVIRLQGMHGGPYWLKPEPDAPGDYTSIAQAYKRVVQGLPRRDGHRIYIEIWNEPNLDIEWSGAPNPIEYAEFLVDVATAIRSLGDSRIFILNGALSPGGNYNNLAFIDAMATVPGALNAFDVWAAHPYPGNHPPEYNIHDGSATYRDSTIDSYLLELERLAAHGRRGLQVLLTETGYALGQNNFAFEGYAPINEGNRADYIKRAFRDYWRNWPEVLGVCPYELVDPGGDWWVWDWLYPDGRRHWQYDSVAALAKETPTVPSRLKIVFQAEASSTGGTYYNQVTALSSNATIPALYNAAPVTVLVPTATPTRTMTRTATMTRTNTSTVTGTPPTPTATPTATVTPICIEQVQNGGFEERRGWQLPQTAYPATYTDEQVYSGQWALRLGIRDGANYYSYSSAWQNLSLSAMASQATLTFWYYPISGDPNDVQMVRIHDEGGALLQILMWESSDAQEWLHKEYDLSAYLGRTIQLYFGVRNDGQGGTTAMYVDEVSVLACGGALVVLTPSPELTPTPTPSATPTASPTLTLVPTQTATPTGSATRPPTCIELVRNPGFEDTGFWELPNTASPAQYTESRAHTGRRSMLIGIGEGENTRSYSSARQLIALPAGATRIVFSFWYFPVSQDETRDRQYALILDEQDALLDTVMWIGSNESAWLFRSYELTRYAGQNVKLHFGVYNDGQGGMTAMYVDNVSVLACWSEGTRTPTPSLPPQAIHLALPVVLKAYEPSARQLLAQDPSLSSARETEIAILQAPGPVSLWSLPLDKGAVQDSTPHLALHPWAKRLYVAWGGQVLTLDTDSGAVLFSLPIGTDVHGLAIDGQRNRLYVSDRDNGQLWVIDEAGTSVLAKVSGISKPADIALTDNRVYVAATGSDELWAFDSNSYMLMNRIAVGRAPYAVAINPATGCILVANAGDGTLTAMDRFDTKPRTVVSLEGLGYPQDIVVNSQRDEFYVSYAISPKYHAIAVINGQTLKASQIWQGDAKRPLLGAYGLALDAYRGRLYVTDIQGLLALDIHSGQTMDILPAGRWAYAGGIAIDPRQKRIYMADLERGGIAVLQD